MARPICFLSYVLCSFHGCVHNLTLNGEIVNLDRLVESDRENGSRLSVASCPADIKSLPLSCLFVLQTY